MEGERDEMLVHALSHPLRRQILRVLHTSGEARSPRELGAALQLPVARVSYHVAVLCEGNALALSDSRPAGGSAEHFYASLLADDASTTELLASTEEEDRASRG